MSSVLNIRDAEPDDHGGRRSRGGFRYQDLCSLRFCVAAAHDAAWDEVWCESHEDIVLIRTSGEIEKYRYVQVKFESNAGQHWSPFQICRVPAGKSSIKESIICKLFRRDRFGGVSDFRLVVNEGVSDDLKPFHYLWACEEPTIDMKCEAARELVRRLAKWSPPEGRSREEFVSRFAVERHSAEVDDMEMRIRDELHRLLKVDGVSLLVDELDQVFQHLYGIVFRAASDEWRRRGHPERIGREYFRSEATSRAQRVSRSPDSVATETPAEALRPRLMALGLTHSAILSALELRQKWISEERRSRGTTRSRTLLEALDEVRVVCIEEQVRSIEIPISDGRVLVSRIFNRVRSLHSTGCFDERGVALPLMYGMVFYLIGRGHLAAEQSASQEACP